MYKRLWPGAPALLPVGPHEFLPRQVVQLRSRRPDGLDLPPAGALGNVDHAPQAESLRGPGHRETVIARTHRGDAAPTFVRREPRHSVPRAADLEGAEALEILEFQQHLIRARRPEWDRGGSGGHLSNHIDGGFDIGKGHLNAHGGQALRRRVASALSSAWSGEGGWTPTVPSAATRFGFTDGAIERRVCKVGRLTDGKNAKWALAHHRPLFCIGGKRDGRKGSHGTSGLGAGGGGPRGRRADARGATTTTRPTPSAWPARAGLSPPPASLGSPSGAASVTFAGPQDCRWTTCSPPTSCLPTGPS